MRALGVDLNQFSFIQKEPENRDGFQRMRQAGVSFAYFQMLQNGSFHPNFPDLWERAGKAGLLRGAYYFWHHDPGFIPDDPNHVDPAIKLIADRAPHDAELPFMVDFEEVPTTRSRTKEIHVFMGTLRKTLKHLVIYTRAAWWEEHTDPENWMKSYDFWLAAWPFSQIPEIQTPDNPNPLLTHPLDDWCQLEDFWPNGSFFPAAAPGALKPKVWQWSAGFYVLPGIVDDKGAGAPVDLDWFDGDLNDLRKWAGLPPAAADDPGFRLGSDSLVDAAPPVEGDRQPVPEEIDLNPAGPTLQVSFKGGDERAANREPASRRRKPDRLPLERALGVDIDKNVHVQKEPEKKDGFQRMRRAGVSFVYMQLLQRLAGGDQFPNGVRDFEFNPQFADQWERAGNAGLLRGAYYFWNHDPDFGRDRPDPTDEMIGLLAKNVPKDAELPLMVDFEGEICIDGKPKIRNWTEEIHQFLIALQARFNRLVLYTNVAWWQTYTRPQDWMRDFDFWMASYPNGQSPHQANPPPKPTLKDWRDLHGHFPDDPFPGAPLGGRDPKIWQWTGDFYFMPGLGEGENNQTNAVLDMNFFNGDVNALREWAGLPTAELTDLGFSLGSDKDQGRRRV